tara:strand:- start:333 stop:650 length:318 start_codon:yes stop_codon:yes gene_type:complete
MITKKKIPSNIFDLIEIDISCDDLIIDKTTDDSCTIILNCTHNLGEVVDRHLEDSSQYEVFTDIIDKILYIGYHQNTMTSLTDFDFEQKITITILIPESIKYKIN